MRLSDYRGRPVLLVFLDPACPWSWASLADLNALAGRHPALAVLALSLHPISAADPRAFAGETRPAFPLLADPSGEAVAGYRPYATPFWFFIRGSGRIAYVAVSDHGLANLDAVVRRELLGEGE